MKNLILILLCISCMTLTSCNKDDDTSNNNPDNITIQGTGFIAKINGETYTDYDFEMTVYNITRNGSTMRIDVGDANGEQITLFLNSTGGFDSGTTKTMGDTDTDNFRTYTLLRPSATTDAYYATTSGSGTATISQNVTHPSMANKRLISGNFNVTTTLLNGSETITLNGAFAELEFDE